MTRTLERRLADYAKELDAASQLASHGTADQPLRPSGPANPPGWRRRAGAFVAVAAVLVAVVAVMTQLVEDKGSEVSTDVADAPPDTGIGDLATALGFFSRQGAADEVAEAYLSDRLDRPVEGLRIERLEPPEGPGARGVGYRWSLSAAPADAGGTIVLRQGPDDWWDVVDARSGVVSIDRVGRHEGELTVEYSGPRPAELRLILQDIGDNVIGQSTCSNGRCSPIVQVPEIPIVLRLQLVEGDVPGSFAERRVDPHSTDDLTTTTLEPGTIPATDLAAAAATQIMDALGDPATIESVETHEPADGGPGTGTVRLVTASGATVDVDVHCEIARERCTVVGLSSPGLSIIEHDRAEVTVPTSGVLTITGLSDFDPAAVTLPQGEVMLADAPVETDAPLEVDLVESSWLQMDLVTDDGRILRYLRPR